MQRLRLGEDDVEPAVAGVAALLRSRGLAEATWWVGELSTPAGLAERLLELGLEPDDPPEMTSLTTGERPTGEPTVEVRRAETLDEALLALEIDWEASTYRTRSGRCAGVRRPRPGRSLRQAGTQSTYLAYLDGDPVGFARAVFTPAAALLLGGATLPEARGNGVYTSLVHARWDEAVERGVPRIAVSAGPMSAPILERLGFDRIGRVRLLRQRL